MENYKGGVLVGAIYAEQITGCRGAGGFYDYFRKHGYKYIAVLDWTSSAGDWQFIVSKNGKVWNILSQTNNYPRIGFSYEVGKDEFYGSESEVLSYLYEG